MKIDGSPHEVTQFFSLEFLPGSISDTRIRTNSLMLARVNLAALMANWQALPSSVQLEHCGRLLREASIVFLTIVVVRYVFSFPSSSLSSTPKKTSDSRRILLALVPAAIVCSPVLLLYFFCDDYGHLMAGSGNVLAVIADSFRHGLPLNHSLYRPFGFAFLMLEVKLWAGWAPGYHMVSLILHLCSAAALFYLGLQCRLRGATAATAAALFAILPVNAEAVAWVACQYDLLATVSFILAAAFYAQFIQKNRKIRLGACALLLILAMLSKESAFVFPLLLLPLHGFVLKSWRASAWSGMLALTCVGFLIRWLVIGGLGGYYNREGRPYVLDFHHTIAGLFRHAPATEFFGLNWLASAIFYPMLLASITVAIFLVLAAIARYSRDGVVPFALCWLLIALLPIHSLLLIGPGLSGSHILYLSSAGVAMLLAVLLEGVQFSALRRGLTAALLLVFSAGMWHNLSAWSAASADITAFRSQLLQSLPSPAPGALLVFDGMPDWDRGVCLGAAGVNAATQFFYQRTDLSGQSGAPPSPEQLRVDFTWSPGARLRRIEK